MRIDLTPCLDFSDVLIQPRRTTITSRAQINLIRDFSFKYSPKNISCVPIIASNMDTTGTFRVYEVLSTYKMITCLNKFIPVIDFETYKGHLHPDLFMISIGIRDQKHELDRLSKIMKLTNCSWICIDVANGHMQSVVDYSKHVRSLYPDKVIVVGNVANPEMTEELIVNGKADIVKVGIGPGSACTTRLKTGCGLPQLTCIYDCSDEAHKTKGHIIGDGGITCPGDACKALVGGADFIMIGGQFAGHDENPGDIIIKNNKKFKRFYGMSSTFAMNKHYGEQAAYRASEGRVMEIAYKGSLHKTVQDYLGGIRSCCTYIDAFSIKDMSKCGKVRIVNNQVNNHFNDK